MATGSSRMLLFSIVMLLDPCPEQKFVSCETILEHGPQNQTVLEGQQTSFICDVNDDNTRIIFWTFSNEPGRRRYVSYDDHMYPLTDRIVTNYEVTINRATKQYELILKSPNIGTDTGRYDCGYEYGPNRKFTVLATAHLTILPMSESIRCIYQLMSKTSNDEVEVVCSWSNVQISDAHFQTSDGHPVEADISTPNRIISRMNSQDISNMNCLVSLENIDVTPINTPCVYRSGENNDGTGGIVRVEPFISEVTSGSNSSFTCSVDNNGFQSQLSWIVMTGEGDALNDASRLYKEGSTMTIINVGAEENMVVECRVSLPGNDQMSSYAALRLVESTTAVDRRTPGKSEQNVTIAKTTSQNNVAVTNIVEPLRRNSVGIVAAVIILVVLILVTMVVVVILIRRRGKKGREEGGKPMPNTDNAMELLEIPHRTHNGSSQIYALSFKDKSAKSDRTMNIEVLQEKERHFKNEISASCGVLNIPPSSSNDQIYAEPDDVVPSPGVTARKCASMPFLDVNEYETMSDPNNAQQMSKAVSSLSVCSARSSSGDRRWTSQRMQKKTLSTPPRARHALSFRKPAVRNTNVKSEYAKMKIEPNGTSSKEHESCEKKIPVYAKPEKESIRGKPSIHAGFEHGQSDKPTSSDDYDYADVEKIGEAPRSSEDDVVDTYLSTLPGLLPSSLPPHFASKKSASLQRPHSMRHVPPKPPRGKCQSEFLSNSSYSVIGDYEIMSKQVMEIKEEKNDYADCDNVDNSRPFSAYDRPKPVQRAKTVHTLPRINDSSSHMVALSGGSTDGQRTKSESYNDYEMVGKGDTSPRRSTDPPPSPHYADINDAVYASINNNDVATSRW